MYNVKKKNVNTLNKYKSVNISMKLVQSNGISQFSKQFLYRCQLIRDYDSNYNNNNNNNSKRTGTETVTMIITLMLTITAKVFNC